MTDLTKVDIATAFCQTLVEVGVEEALARYGMPETNFWASGFGDITGQVATNLQIMRDHIAEPMKMLIHGAVADGNCVAIEGSVNVRLKDARTYSNRYHFLYEFEGERIVRVREYHDTAHAFDIWARYFPQ
jgi:limonene-1,2-epoxide hydrolase